MKKFVAVIFLGIAFNHCFAESKLESTKTDFSYRADAAKGATLRKHIDDAYQLIKNKRLDEAMEKLRSTQAAYEKLFTKNLKQHSFSSLAEVNQFKKANLVNYEWEWIDWGYEQSLQLQAFIHSERRDFNNALQILERARQVAPISAQLDIETAYTYGITRRSSEAYSLYVNAEKIARSYDSQRTFLAPALRGKGTTLIELDRLDEAETAFMESLKVDPNNKIAVSELKFIKNAKSSK